MEPLLQEKYDRTEWVEKRDRVFTRKEVEEIPGEELNGVLKKKLPYCLWIEVEDKDFRKMAEPL